MNAAEERLGYRGRLAPSPTGYLHLGHARTFWVAQQRAREQGGTLILRNEDLDPDRSRPEFADAMMEDLRWFGFAWQEGSDCGGPFEPYDQSRRHAWYRAAFEQLKADGWVYPCTCSRRDVQHALQAPHAGDDEPVYPGTCRPKVGPRFGVESPTSHEPPIGSADIPVPFPQAAPAPCGKECPRSAPFMGPMRGHGIEGASHVPRGQTPRVNWRFQVPDGESLRFTDGRQGPQAFVAGRDLGDFVVWRHDGVPSYQLAVVVDDAAMKVTEVVRGVDLLVSTARQLLLYRALGLTPPAFFHCPLVTDEAGVRLAKRHDALSLRRLREEGADPEQLRESGQKW